MRIILFLDGVYIASIEELRQVMLSNNGKSKKHKSFGKELLGLWDDGILEPWLVEHHCQQVADKLALQTAQSKMSDNEKIAIVYRIITGIECEIDFESTFYEIVELCGYEKNGEIFHFENKDFPELKIEDSDTEVKFVFKAIENVEIPLCFELKIIGAFSIADNSFYVGERETSMTAVVTNTFFAGDEFSISFSFKDINVLDRKGKYLLKFLGKKTELICELVYDVKEDTFVKLFGELSRVVVFKSGQSSSKEVRRYCENHVKKKYVKFGDKGIVSLYYVGTLLGMSKINFWVLCDERFWGKKSAELEDIIPPKNEYNGTLPGYVYNKLDKLNRTVNKGSFRLITEEELNCFFRWASFWNDDYCISIGYYFAYYNSISGLSFCNVDLEEEASPPSALTFFVYEDTYY